MAAIGCGVDKNEVRLSSCDLLLAEAPAADIIISSKELGFDIIPGNADCHLLKYTP